MRGSPAISSFIITSLDGFYEDANGIIDWVQVDAEFEELAVRQLDAVNFLGFGRLTYEHMAAYWPTDDAAARQVEIAARMNGMNKLCFTRSTCETP